MVKLSNVGLLVVLFSATAFGRQAFQGSCTKGGQVAITSGISSTTKILASYPGCTVSVFNHGLATLATIFDDNGVSLANPFTASVLNGVWLFTANNGHYDVVLSGGTPSFPTPETITDILLNDPTASNTVTATAFISASANPATSGVLQVASADTLACWKSNLGGPDLCFTKNSSDVVDLNTALTIHGPFSTSGNPITASTITGTTGAFSGAITGASYSGGPIVGTTGTFSGTVSAQAISGTTGTFSGAITGAGYSGGPISGTTGTFSGVVSAGGLSNSGAFTGNTVALTNAGIFTDTQLNLYSTSNVNSLNFTNEFQIAEGNHATTEGITAGVASPIGGTVLQAEGVGGYATNGSATTFAFGGYFQSRCLANSTKCGGINPVAFDTTGLTSGITLYGSDLVIAPRNANTAYSIVEGYSASLAGLANGQGYGQAYDVSSQSTSIWNFGFRTRDASASTALQVGALCASGSCGSQPIAFSSYNASVLQSGSFQQEASGVMDLVPTSTSGLLLGTVTASQQLISSVSTGTPPIVVSSATVVPNLNVKTLNGVTISGTPSSGQGIIATSSSAAAWQAIGGSFSCVNVTPVTVSANVTTDQILMACTIPAGTLNTAAKTLSIQGAGVYSTPAGSTSTVNVKIKLCTVSGCGSGTVITLASVTSAALGAIQATNDPFNFQLFSSTQTTGASAAFEAHGNLTIDISALTTAAEAVYADGNTATVGTIDSTAQLFLQITGAFSAGSASNSITQRQLTAESVN